MPYPVTVGVEPALTNRNRLTTAFRLILAIPHLILVGGIGFGVASQGDGSMTRTSIGEGGLLGAVAFFVAIVSWFTIVIAGVHIIGHPAIHEVLHALAARKAVRRAVSANVGPGVVDEAVP